MNRRTARAIEQGRGSLLVTLPKDWVRGVGLRKGDSLDLSYDGFCVKVRPSKGGSSTGDAFPGAPASVPARPAIRDAGGLGHGSSGAN